LFCLPFAFCLAEASAADQRFPADPVEQLRQVLKVPIRNPLQYPERLTARQREADKHIQALHRLGDLRRALMLQEWRDSEQEVDDRIRETDRALRAEVAQKFRQAARDTLEQGDPTSRLAVVNMLSEMGVSVRGVGTRAGVTRELTAALAALVKDKDPAVRTAAARALGKINPAPDEAVPALDSLLQADEVALRRAAADALVNLVRTVYQLYRGKNVTGVEATRDEVIQLAAAVVPVAGRGVGDADPAVRRLSIEAIQQAAFVLGELVPQLDPFQDLAGIARKQVADERAVLDEFQQQTQDLLRLAGVLSEHVPALGRALSDPDPAIRLISARALEDLGQARLKLRRPGNAAVPARGPQAAARPQGVQLAAAQEVPVKPAGPDPLLEGLRGVVGQLAARVTDKDVRVRLAVVETLEMLEEHAAPAAPALIKALADRDLFVRWAAARTLGKTGPVEAATAVPALIRLVGDPDLDVRIATAGTLQRYGPAAKEAIPALTKAVQTGDAEIRVAAIQALEAIGTAAQPAIPTLINALAHPDVRVRREAAIFLGKFGPDAKDSADTLRRLLDDPDEEVRKAASDALVNVLQPPK
jgi:HEAT repeat protein